jgi:hypothetical protein
LLFPYFRSNRFKYRAEYYCCAATCYRYFAWPSAFTRPITIEMSVFSKTDTGGLQRCVNEWSLEEEKRLEKLTQALGHAQAAHGAAEESNVIWKELGERREVERLLASKESCQASLQLYDTAAELLLQAADANSVSEGLKELTTSETGAHAGDVPDCSFETDQRRRHDSSWNYGNFQLLATSDVRFSSPDPNWYAMQDVEETTSKQPSNGSDLDNVDIYVNDDREGERSPATLNFGDERRGEDLSWTCLKSGLGFDPTRNVHLLERLQTDQRGRDLEVERQLAIIERGMADEGACMESCRRMKAADDGRQGAAGMVARQSRGESACSRDRLMERWTSMEEDARASWEEYGKMEGVLRRCHDEASMAMRLVLINACLRELHLDPDMLALQLERANDLSAEAKSLLEVIGDANWTNP